MPLNPNASQPIPNSDSVYIFKNAIGVIPIFAWDSARIGDSPILISRSIPLFLKKIESKLLCNGINL
nr:hypothetical protein [Borrelia duttonii]